MTASTYGWVTDQLAQQQIAALGKTATPTALTPDVMKAALEYATSSGIPLDQVLAMLTGGADDLAAE